MNSPRSRHVQGLALVPLTLLMFPTELVAQTPSFNCAGVKTPSQKLICGDSTLAAQDSEMVNDIKAVLLALPADQQAAFRNEQSRWFREYSRTCNSPMTAESRRACIVASLGEHIKSLKMRMGPTLTAGPSHPVIKACATDFIIGGVAMLIGTVALDALGGGGVVTTAMLQTAGGAAVVGCLGGAMHEQLKQNGTLSR